MPRALFPALFACFRLRFRCDSALYTRQQRAQELPDENEHRIHQQTIPL